MRAQTHGCMKKAPAQQLSEAVGLLGQRSRSKTRGHTSRHVQLHERMRIRSSMVFDILFECAIAVRWCKVANSYNTLASAKLCMMSTF